MKQKFLILTEINYKEHSYEESDEEKYDEKDREEKMDPTGCSFGH